MSSIYKSRGNSIMNPMYLPITQIQQSTPQSFSLISSIPPRAFPSHTGYFEANPKHHAISSINISVCILGNSHSILEADLEK